jgi:hypothetical protein
LNERARKKPPDSAQTAETDELREHYDFDYSKAKPKHFAEWVGQDSLMVVLEPDVAAIFPTTEAVNDTLRAIAALLANMSQVKSAQRRQNNAVREAAQKAQTQVGSVAG